MADHKPLVNTDSIDKVLAQSTIELERLASVYRQHGFSKESNDLLSTVVRIRRHMDSQEFETLQQEEAL